MTGVWFIGDPHFGHRRVAEIRGYSSVNQHDAAIIEAWESVVKADDTVYVMGDLSGGSEPSERRALEIIFAMPGSKGLIAGNHDSIAGIHRKVSPNTDLFRAVFEKISDFGSIAMDGKRILLSHYPYASQGDGPGRGAGRYEQFRLPDCGGMLIHAHTHHTDPASGSKTGRELCVSWDAWRRMVNIGDIAQWVNGQKPEGQGA